jgi:hypothetical protein
MDLHPQIITENNMDIYNEANYYNNTPEKIRKSFVSLLE